MEDGCCTRHYLFLFVILAWIVSSFWQRFLFWFYFISQIRKSGGKTLVHCVAGVSRSATLCIAYLMKYQHMSLLQAYNYVKSKRPQIKPNNGFFRQLIDYEYRLFGENSVKMVYNDYVNAEIPEVYACDYQKMIWFQKTYNRNFGRH